MSRAWNKEVQILTLSPVTQLPWRCVTRERAQNWTRDKEVPEVLSTSQVLYPLSQENSCRERRCTRLFHLKDTIIH